MIQQGYILLLLAIIFVMGVGSCDDAGTNPSMAETVKPASVAGHTPQQFQSTAPMVKIVGGEYVPLYGKNDQKVKINSFYMDVFPVTQADFLLFVEKNGKWKKSNRKKIFADERYLYHWKSDTIIGNERIPESPVTNISWFAANAYCECQGKRLPKVDEWEYVAMANETMPDARKEKSYNQRILDWYEKPQTFLYPVGQTSKNYWGIYDLHGLVWEWTSDFSSILITGESRNDVSTDKELFCGTGSLNATDLMNYAAFIRYAFRGSVKGNYCIQNLGFRCVRDSISN